MFATMMVFLDTTVVNLSLPYIAGSLSSSIPESTWALTSYLAANAVILPMSGWLANTFGRKRLLLFSLVSFTGASVLCGLAPTLEFLIIFRVLQGLTGGVMQPISQAVMLEGFPPRERGKAMGIWSLGIIAAPILGPLLGGWLTEVSSWRWVFLINVPFGVFGILLVQRYVIDPSYIRRRTHTVDYTGIGLLALGVGALQVMLDRGQDEDWLDSRLIVFLLLTGIAASIAFVWSSLRKDEPVVDLSPFRDRTFAIGSVLSSLIGFLLYGSIVLLPLMLQTLLGYPPLDAGLIIAQRGLGALLAFPIVGALTTRVDGRILLTSGLLLGALTMFWFARLDHTLGAADLFAPQFLQGIALGLLFVPLTTITMSPISNENMGNASSVFNMARNFGSSIGIAVTATVLDRSLTIHRSLLAEHVSNYDPLTRNRLAELALVGSEVIGSRGDTAAVELVQGLERQASLLSFLTTFRFFGWIFLAMVPWVFLMKNPRYESRDV